MIGPGSDKKGKSTEQSDEKLRKKVQQSTENDDNDDGEDDNNDDNNHNNDLYIMLMWRLSVCLFVTFRHDG